MNITGAMNSFYYHMSLYELQMMNGSDYYNGLSYNSLLYINVISLMEQCTASKIAKALGVTKSAVTLKLNELAKQGIINRVQSEDDKRVIYITLSRDMEHIIGIYDEVFDRIQQDLQMKYTKEQLTFFEEILHTISGYEWRKFRNE